MNRYVLIGCGGTGSHFIAPALAYLHAYQLNQDKDWQFTVVDGDHYEYKNLERQLFDANFVGQNKADAMKEMYGRYPIISLPKFIGRDDMATLIPEESVVFLGVDNYSVRALVIEHALKLKNVVIINAGNEKVDGTVQLWVRKDGKNKTPVLTFCHPEIEYKSDQDRSSMTCAQAALMPGGEQLILANFSAAQGMLHALWRYHSGAWEKGWTELNFDLEKNLTEFIDFRERKGWDTHTPAPVSIAQPMPMVAPIGATA